MTRVSKYIIREFQLIVTQIQALTVQTRSEVSILLLYSIIIIITIVIIDEINFLSY